jgi:hypothetical protein
MKEVMVNERSFQKKKPTDLEKLVEDWPPRSITVGIRISGQGGWKKSPSGG